MKNFHIRINYDGHFASFNIVAEDRLESVEQSILDKLGRNKIKFEKDGFTRGRWITYEEVINDPRPVQTKKVLGVELGAGV